MSSGVNSELFVLGKCGVAFHRAFKNVLPAVSCVTVQIWSEMSQ